MPRLIAVALLLFLINSCGFEEFENEPPIHIMGFIMLDSNQPAMVDTFQLSQLRRYYEDLDFWAEDVITDSNGFFFFEYARNNKKHGGHDCERAGGIALGTRLSSSFWDVDYFATCLPVNIGLGPVFYLNHDARVELLFSGEVEDGDTLFFNIPPIESSHPNYYERIFNGDTLRALAVPGPFTDLSLIYHADNPNPLYEGWKNGLRGEFQAFYARSWDVFLIKHENTFDHGLPVRLRGRPFVDRISIANHTINYYP